MKQVGRSTGRRVLVVVTMAAALVVAAPTPRPAAHGPCHCTVPAIAPPGAEIRTGRAYLAVWNPPPYWLAGGVGPAYLGSAYRPEAPTRVVVERPRPRYPDLAPPGRFRIPHDAPLGVHLLLVLDGSEAGTHGTWDYVHVIDPQTGTEPNAGALHVELSLLRDVLPFL